jgi:dGTP triphosphohydrolase
VIRLLRGLVDQFADAPHRVPDAGRLGSVPEPGSDAAAARAVHYVSGMTDRYAIRTYERLFLPRGWLLDREL